MLNDVRDSILFVNAVFWSARLGEGRGAWVPRIPFVVADNPNAKSVWLLQFGIVNRINFGLNHLAYEWLQNVPLLVAIHSMDEESGLSALKVEYDSEKRTLRFSLPNLPKEFGSQSNVVQFQLDALTSTDSSSGFIHLQQEKVKSALASNQKLLSSIYDSLRQDVDKVFPRLKNDLSGLCRDNHSSEIDKMLEKLALYLLVVRFSSLFGWCETYFFPSLTHKRGDERGAGGLFIALSSNILGSKARCQKRCLSLLVNMKYRELAISDWIEKVLLHALQSAVAAIMARNMSHHEGSHILPRARVSDILQRLQELELGLQPGYIMAVIQDAKDRLDEYIAKKQDFLAEITSEPLTTTKTAYFWQDVIAPMVQNVLLMDTIAANEGVRYADKERNRLVLKVFFNGQEVKARFSCTHHDPVIYPDSYPYTGFCPKCNRYNEQALLQFTGTEGGGDFAVELPGPVGEHAVYTFLENLIRNATKHNLQKLQTNPDQSVEVCIDVAEEDEEFYKVEVSENISEAIVAQRLEEYIKTPLVDDAGELKREAWGIAEMKVAAALLKGSTEWEKLQGDTAKEFLDVKEKDGKLVYRLYMMRPKRVCALVPNHGLEVDIGRMKRAGVWIFRDIQEVKDALYKSRSPASFKFAFLDLKNIANLQDLESLDLKELEPCLPFRVIVRVKSELRQQVQALLPNAVFVDDTVSYSISDPEKFVCELWRSWLGRWAEKTELHLYLGQEEGRKPTSDWKALAEKWSADGYRPFIWYDREQEQNGSKKRVQVSEPDSGNSEPPRVVFDRHAVIANQLKMGPELGIKDCYFAFDKLNSDFIWIFSSSPSEEMVYSLLEAGLLRILVVDSRIAERAYDYDVINREWTASLVQIMESTIFPGVPREARSRPKPMRWHIGCIGKVFICTHLGINGDPLPLHPSAKEVPYLKLRVDMRDSSPSACIELKSNEGAEMCKIRIELDNGGRAVSGKIDFDMIIIHQGDIESRRPEGFNYSDFIASLKRLFPFVVVDSGRGIPPEVQSTPGVKFLPFSLLNSYLGGKRIDKARLTQVVMPLRRRLQQ
jgi:hypothetical protein